MTTGKTKRRGKIHPYIPPLYLLTTPDLIFQNFSMLPYVVLAYFLSVSFVILLTKAVPDLNKLLHYGKVSQVEISHGSAEKSDLAKLVDKLAQLTVPKTWFLHFYIVFASTQWLQVLSDPKSVLRRSKYLAVWLLLTVQATRRLAESFALTNWGNKLRMHVSHYMVGIFYYLGVSLTCWLGLRSDKSEFEVGAVDLMILLTFVLFAVDQFQNHRHLALLVKYSVPKFRFFRLVSCAHYMDEICIYFSVLLLVLVHGPFSEVDFAFLTSWIFVVVNLSVSASETWNYYKVKFDDYDVQYAVIPYLM